MLKNIKVFTLLALVLAGLIFCVKYFSKQFDIMKPAPQGINGLYKLSGYQDLLYTTKLNKDTLLAGLEKDGLSIKRGKLNTYDAEWDSLRYLISNITCDTLRIEPYIEFQRDIKKDVLSFRILWINGTPNLSYDTTVYNSLAKKYYDCFEAILKRHEVNVDYNR
jgi:hypothetical protein